MAGRRALTPPLLAVLVAAGVSVLLEALYYPILVTERSPGYLVLCAAFTLAAALLLVAVAVLAPLRARLALALWAALHGFLVLHFAAGLSFGLTSYALLSLGPDPDRRALARALPVVGALWIALVFWPWTAAVLPPPSASLLRDVLLPTLVYGASLGVLLALAPLRRSLRFVPPPGLATLGILAALFACVFASMRAHPDRNVPVYARAAPAGEHASILVLILDTVGAQHTSLYGYARETTPRLRAFLERSEGAVLYSFAHSPATWTYPAHASLFAGTLPSSHGVHEGTMFAGGSLRMQALRADQTLAERLREHGYRTALILANGALAEMPGVGRGFDWNNPPLASRGVLLVGEQLRRRITPEWYLKQAHWIPQARTINDRILRFLDACEPAPCFVVANYMEAHAPYRAEAPHAGVFARNRVDELGPAKLGQSRATLEGLVDRYDEEILALDAALGELLEALERRGTLDRSWLVITSDHGEAFGEHGVTEHGTTVYGEVTHVPLLIRPPRGERLPPESGAVSLLDVTATVAAVATGSPFGVGRDLRQPEDGPAPVQIEFFGQPRKVEEFGALAGEPARAVVHGSVKLIEHAGRLELYRLDQDAAERNDRFGVEPGLAEPLRAQLPTLAAPGGFEDAAPLTPQAEQALRALGYVQ